MEQNEVNKILQEIESGYNRMARKFSETRKFFWRDLEFVKKYSEGNVLDYGCGNGRLLELIDDKEIEYYGVDISENLINLAKEKYRDFPQVHFQKIKAQETSLPFSGNFFNSSYSIAVFHHIPTQERRIKMAEELRRILKPGGYAIVTVWNLWPASLRQAVVSASRGGQKKYYRKILKNWINKILRKSQLDWNDCYIRFKNNEGEIFERYHHAFTKRELRNLFESAGFKTEKCAKLNRRNLVYIGKK
jgi:ubiquinone/menaquinone biosynthesis C-methylase UbiE